MNLFGALTSFISTKGTSSDCFSYHRHYGDKVFESLSLYFGYIAVFYRGDSTEPWIDTSWPYRTKRGWMSDWISSCPSNTLVKSTKRFICELPFCRNGLDKTSMIIRQNLRIFIFWNTVLWKVWPNIKKLFWTSFIVECRIAAGLFE